MDGSVFIYRVPTTVPTRYGRAKRSASIRHHPDDLEDVVWIDMIAIRDTEKNGRLQDHAD